VCVFEAVLFCPLGIARGRASIELGVLVAEHKTHFDVWMLLFDEQVFLSISDSKSSLAFDKKMPTFRGDFEVG